jgi:hypothetical protein
VVDLAYFYPENLKPSISRWAYETLATSYKDQFFIREIPFFSFFRLLEVLHIPVCLWGIKAVLTSMSLPPMPCQQIPLSASGDLGARLTQTDDYKLPLVLVVYATEVVVTTATCMYDTLFWENTTQDDLLKLSTIYGPYVAFSAFMFVDGWARTKGQLRELQVLKGSKKRL